MNEEVHWDGIAPEYTEEVLNVYEADQKGILKKYIGKYADRNKTATDFGCGIGNGFPILAPAFKQVLGTDISAECLNIAKKRGYKNVQLKKADLTSARLKLPPADFGVCINVLLLPKVDENRKILRNVYKSLKPNASAIFVLPAMESILHTGWSMMEWYKKEGIAVKDIPKHEFSAFKAAKPDLLQGIIDIQGVPTKHYLQTEIEVLFSEAGFKISTID
ncbi:MAG TPA: class I SAM-dependent methyltransferase, partial [Cyclobacteriaceae bacterium]|nr:class I SAM-dependent methyltransferase [Cyclobacteriaceae bacterium]